MNVLATDGALERRLAATLSLGTWISSAMVAAGLLSPVFGIAGGPAIVMSGVALIILLPVLRVALMLSAFVSVRNYRFAILAAVVLLIICLGVVVGLHSAIRH